VGGGGREYAIAWRLARCDSVATIDVVPGNAGVALFSRVIDFSPHDVGRLQQHLAASAIDLAIVGPDELIAEGLGDHLRRASVAVVAPSKEAAKIEWSKTVAKELMTEAHVPTPRWRALTTPEQARNAVVRNNPREITSAWRRRHRPEHRRHARILTDHGAARRGCAARRGRAHHADRTSARRARHALPRRDLRRPDPDHERIQSPRVQRALR